ncbi:target of Nesh-SH3-like [Brachionichthys hirsutus]|uniref:target of Nesh-SH3-like n=1 Tax=Brachionichthys hirsutus TaxID=412623 RepID=UPI0036053A17
MRSSGFLVLVLMVFISGIVLSAPLTSRRTRVSRQNMKVRINATGDTIVMKFLHPDADTKLEGYILGYGSSLFSKQFIQLPENGEPYETEMDAEPKYLIAVRPMPNNEVKRQCTGKVELQKPLHLVIGAVTPTSVLLSWGALLKTPYEGNIMNDCLEDGHYTVRYREKNRKWNYQTCPTSDTVIDNLKPNGLYEFGVQSNTKEGPGKWSKLVTHNISRADIDVHLNRTQGRLPLSKTISPKTTVVHLNRTQGRLPLSKTISPKTTVVHHSKTQGRLPLSKTISPKTTHVHHNKTQSRLPLSKTISPKTTVVHHNRTQGRLPPSKTIATKTTVVHHRKNQGRLPLSKTIATKPTLAPSPPEEGKPLPRPALATEKAGSYKHGTGVVKSSVAEVPRSPISSSVPPVGRNSTLSHSRITPHSTRNTVRTLSPSKTLSTSLTSNTPGADGVNHKGNALPKPVWSKEKPVLHPAVPANNRRNLVEKHSSGHDKLTDMKEGNESILKPFALVTAKPKQERQQKTTTPAPTVNSSRFDIGENSSIFQPLPTSDIDIMGKKRFVAPHVIYKTDKKPDEPCSITSSLSYFPEEEGNDLHVTSPPRIPPSNVTVVTVEGCSSFVIIDWEKSDNETKEYDVVSTAKGPNGKEVSVVTTNQTHTAVENLKPESSYEFQVTPKNELGTGPSSDPVSFNTESADPRVSEEISGKAAIWSQFPFQPDAYSECNGRMFIKRTWYRKFVGIQLCNSLRYQIYLSDSLNGKFHNIGDLSGYGEDHCQFVDSHLDGRTGIQMPVEDLPSRPGFYRAMRQEPVSFGEIGGTTRIPYVGWYECGKSIPGKW